jgi:HEAT repeat protein
MTLKLPRPRLRLRTLAIVVALVALALWAGISIWSPTRRLGRLLRADQPVYVRREAASSLGRAIPPWEVDQAISLLIGALGDPSPRVREYATVGLFELGPRAQLATSKLIAILKDQDRFVRFAGARTLGLVGASPAKHDAVVAALTHTVDDVDPYVRVAAAEALLKLGEVQKGAGTLVTALGGTDSRLRSWARSIIQSETDTRPFVALLAREMQNVDSHRREEALQVMILVASPEAVKSALESAADGEDTQAQRWAYAQLEQLDSDR